MRCGGKLIDTPGIRELAMHRLEANQVQLYFPEIESLFGQCRFNDCAHQAEPGCAVRAAIQAGTLGNGHHLVGGQHLARCPDGLAVQGHKLLIQPGTGSLVGHGLDFFQIKTVNGGFAPADAHFAVHGVGSFVMCNSRGLHFATTPSCHGL